ncbi:hypothetical protein CMEL01_01897, partial [Colletotrichum melonis]
SPKTPRGPSRALPRFTSTGLADWPPQQGRLVNAGFSLQRFCLLSSQPSAGGQGSCTVPQPGSREPETRDLRDTFVPGSGPGALLAWSRRRPVHFMQCWCKVGYHSKSHAFAVRIEGVERMVPVESWSRRRLAPTAAAGSYYRWR